MTLKMITKQISYLPASEEPLSAEVGIIHGANFTWIFDVGSNAEAVKIIQNIAGRKNIVLSHFHADHMANMSRLNYTNVYCSNYTRTKLPKGLVVNSLLFFEDGGVQLRLFSLPSTHSKGAVGLEVNGEYVFLGDAVYGAPKQGKMVYNINMLKDMLVVLAGLKAQKFLLSHAVDFIQPKEKVLTELQQLYAKRQPGEAYLRKE